MDVTRNSFKDFDAIQPQANRCSGMLLTLLPHSLTQVGLSSRDSGTQGCSAYSSWPEFFLFTPSGYLPRKFSFKQAALSPYDPFWLDLEFRLYSVSCIPQPNTPGSRHFLALLVLVFQPQKWPFSFGNELRAKLSVAVWWLKVLSAAAG